MLRCRVRVAVRDPAWRACGPSGDGVDELQVAGVEAERQMDLLPRGGRPVAAVAQVVLDVAAPEVEIRGRRPRTRGRCPAGCLPMMLARTFSRPRWAMANTISTMPWLARLLDGQVKQRNQAFRPFEREALRATYFFWMNSSKTTASVSRVRMRSCSCALERRVRFSVLSIRSCSHGATLMVVDVHELHADRAAVGVAQPFEDHRRKVRTSGPANRIGGNHAI